MGVKKAKKAPKQARLPSHYQVIYKRRESKARVERPQIDPRRTLSSRKTKNDMRQHIPTHATRNVPDTAMPEGEMMRQQMSKRQSKDAEELNEKGWTKTSSRPTSSPCTS